MKRLLIAAALVLLPLVLLPAPAVAGQCEDYAAVANDLAAKYREQPFAEYDSMQGAKIVMFVSPIDHTVTIVYLAGDKACFVDAGQNFKPADLPGAPS